MRLDETKHKRHWFDNAKKKIEKIAQKDPSIPQKTAPDLKERTRHISSRLIVYGKEAG
jgi:hypothetical protein